MSPLSKVPFRYCLIRRSANPCECLGECIKQATCETAIVISGREFPCR